MSPASLVKPAIAAAIVAMVSQSHAAVLAEYLFATASNFTQSTTSTAASGTSTDTDGGSTASAFTAGAGLVGVTAASGGTTTITGISGQGSPAASSIFARIGGTTASGPDAISGNDYYGFSVTPSAGLMNLTSLTLATAITTSTPATFVFDGTIFVRSSVNGFSTDLASWTQTSVETGQGWTSRTVSLTDPLFQNLTTATEFRFYFYSSSSSVADPASVMRIDSVVLNGTVIPEPTVFGLFGVASLVFCTRRRTRVI